MRKLFLVAVVLLGGSFYASAQTIVAEGGEDDPQFPIPIGGISGSILCSDLDNLNILLVYLKDKDNMWKTVPDCWRVPTGGTVISLNVIGPYGYVAHNQPPTISKAWTYLGWWREKK